MNDHVKKFMEVVSQDDKLIERMKNSIEEEVFTIANELGLSLTKEDIEEVKAESLSDDELEAVNGGKWCACAGGGGGTGTKKGQYNCVCVVLGDGYTKIPRGDYRRCLCVVGGGGSDKGYDD